MEVHHYPLPVMSASGKSNVTGGHEVLDLTHHPLDETPSLKWFFAVSLILQSIFGTIGGFLVIGSVFVVDALHHPGNAFIVNLAVADLCVTAVATPANALGALYGDHFFSTHSIYCSFVSVLCATGCLASCWNMCMIAVNRYMYICHWDIYGKVYTHRNTLLLCLAVWLIAYLIHLPNYVGWGDLRFSEQFFLCTFANHEHTYAIFYVVVGVFFPLTISFLSYLKIYLKVKDSKMIRRRILSAKSDQSVDDNGTGSLQSTSLQSVSTSLDNTLPTAQNKDLSEEPIVCASISRKFYDDLKIIQVLFRVQVIYTVMWLPLMILILVHMSRDISSLWYILVILSAHGNSAINCLVYAAQIDHFREGYQKLLGLNKRNRNSGPGVARRGTPPPRQRKHAYLINTASSAN